MAHLSAKEHGRKEQILTQHHASHIEANASVVLKHGEMFLLTTQGGDVPWELPHALGLFHHDVRFLDGYDLTLNDQQLVTLSGAELAGGRSRHYLTNASLLLHDGSRIEGNSLLVLRQRAARGTALVEMLTIRSFATHRVSLTLRLRFRSLFQDLFVVKGFMREHAASPSTRVQPPNIVHLCRQGADDVLRTTRIGFNPPPDAMDETSVEYRVAISAGASERIAITIEACVGSPSQCFQPRAPKRVEHWLSLHFKGVTDRATRVQSSNPVFDRVIGRGLNDLGMLRSRIDGLHYFAAGIPWFVTLFGRDSALVALQMLPFSLRIGGETARLLARYQAHECDAYRDAEPGKILHELRRGELSRAVEIPQSPTYYGSVDSTLLFLRLIAGYVHWSGDLELAAALRPSIDLALKWIEDYGDHDGDGYIDYVGRYSTGLLNQGWKDSGDGIVREDGSLPEPPIALVEVQGYVFRAWRDIAALYRCLGEDARASELEDKAEALRERFNRDFWSDDLRFYVLALERGGKRVTSVASNGAHVLESGIVEPSRVTRIAERLFEEDLYSGWGIRTLSSSHPAYNPMSYHRGSVWPHDNAMIIAGLCRYGMRREALRLFAALVDAASHTPDFRLPELFCGYTREEQQRHPVPYPVACRPQAWAAAAVPYALSQLLGLDATVTEGRVRVIRPTLPDGIDVLQMQSMRIGAASVDLRFIRRTGDEAAVESRVDGRGLRVESVS